MFKGRLEISVVREFGWYDHFSLATVVTFSKIIKSVCPSLATDVLILTANKIEWPFLL